LEINMRGLILVALAVAAMATVWPAQATAGMSGIPFYPWCALSPGGKSGEHRSCGYVSYAQCMESVRGQTGICFENIWGASRASVVESEDRRPRKRR
jgi:hypothetical protein